MNLKSEKSLTNFDPKVIYTKRKDQIEVDPRNPEKSCCVKQQHLALFKGHCSRHKLKGFMSSSSPCKLEIISHKILHLNHS